MKDKVYEIVTLLETLIINHIVSNDRERSFKDRDNAEDESSRDFNMLVSLMTDLLTTVTKEPKG